MTPKDTTDRWIQDRVAGMAFADIGGVGVQAANQRVIFAARCGAARCVMADIQEPLAPDWKIFRDQCVAAGVVEMPGIDIRDRKSLAAVGRCDMVHSTGILYHVPSPAEALLNLRSITGRYLITNTVIFPDRIENQAGTIELPAAGVLFIGALTDAERRVLDCHLKSKFDFTTRRIAPRPEGGGKMHWIENGELSCWPWWWLYTPHAFRSLVKVCGLSIVEEWMWENHSLQVLCEVG